LVGIHASSSSSRWKALEPIRQGVAKHFGAVTESVAAGLILHHDNGSNYLADDFQDEIEFLGIEISPAFVRQP
jgi:transposase InsO family protein